MDITYLGHSSFKLTNRKVTLVTDPFTKEAVGLPYPKVSADIVTVSHDHGDHNATNRVTNTKRVIDGPGEYEVEGVSVIGIDSFHDNKKGELRGKNTIYVIEMDGFRVAHLGDLGHALNEKKLSLMGDIDILMVPVGGVYTIDAKTAIEVIRSIEPTYIVPMHFKINGMDMSKFGKLTSAKEFISDISTKVEETSKFSIKTGSLLPDEQEVILFK